ncbi:MAG: sodium:solute symporter family protein [Burkholderiales bacterium]|jgi:SSS family transporter|nr:sodium:solute symporter family protein [Burkholderiales bacterium]
MTVLAWSVVAYLAVSVAIGLFAARRVRGARDFAVAGRRLPLPVVVATVFATWFGAETVLGVSSTFVRDGLPAVAGDPFGASLALVLVALFFAARLYRLNLLTIGDYFRQRYDRRVEVGLSLAIVVGYLGWTAAQFAALGLVFNVVSGGAIPVAEGMALGALVVLVYTLAGGMWSVALTDFFQMIVIVAGMLFIGWTAADLAGGAEAVIASAAASGKLAMPAPASAREALAILAAMAPLALGSIPQQDTFQRVMSARDERTAVRGALVGGLLYLALAAVPMFLAYSALLVDPAATARYLDSDPQLVLPRLVLDHMPLAAQILFFGALLSAIMSSASGALLAPAVAFTENVLRPFARHMGDRQLLWATRASVATFAVVVLAVALGTNATIYEMVEQAYKVTLVAAFVPLVAGLYWKRATTRGAIAAALAGTGVWIACEILVSGALVPPALAGLGASTAGMLVGSWAENARAQGRARAPR